MHILSHTSGILEAINYNGLLYFLLANVLTGAVNLSINTLQQSSACALTILCTYLLILNSIICVLHRANIQTKFW